MRILVYQVARMGDVLQTTPLIRAIRNRYPDAHIALMVRDMGRPIAERNPDIDEILDYDEEQILQNLKANDSNRLLDAYRQAQDQLGLLIKEPFDIAFNCVNSTTSAMFLKMAGIPEVIGAHLGDDWHFVLRGKWPTYFFTSVFYREFNDVNLSDIMRHFIDDPARTERLVFEVADDDRRYVDELLEAEGIGEGSFIACMQLGASEKAKRWPEEQFAQLAGALVRRYDAKVLLVGVEKEAESGKNFERYAPGISTHLFGRTTVGQLAALLERADVLVTNDTGTMHIAAAVQCPVALVSVGYVHFRETGPYGDGHYAVEFRRPRVGMAGAADQASADRDKISPEAVLHAVESAVGSKCDGTNADNHADPSLAQVDIYVSRFAPDGLLEWYPVVPRPITEPDFIRIAYRFMWLHYLRTHSDEHAETESITRLLECYDAPAGGSTGDWRREHTAALNGFIELLRRGVERTETLLDVLDSKKGMRKAHQLAVQLTRIDEEIRLYSELNHICKPLAKIAWFERDSLEGADPDKLAEQTLRIYNQGIDRARLMQTKLERVARIRDDMNDDMNKG